MRKNYIIAALLLCIGLAQMIGAVLDIAPLKGLAAGSAASPAPKVFTSVKGMETFSTRFTLHWVNGAGKRQQQVVTHDVYPGLLGPYNRRNVWGAILAYGPFLATEPMTKDMFDAIMQNGLCGQAPVLRELGLDPDEITNLSIVYSPRAGTITTLPLELNAECGS